MNDLRYALRALLKAPAFTSVAVLTLALGIGATTAIFSLFDAVLLKSLPVRNPDELFIVPAGQYPMFQAVRRETDMFSDVLASVSIDALDIAIDGGDSEKAQVALVSASYFSTLGVAAAIGRVFDSGDEQPPGQPAITVASYGFWLQRLAKDPGVVGRRIRVRGIPLTIVGVAPEGFFGEEVGVAPSLWIPLTMSGQVVPGRNLLQSPATAWLRTIGRLKPGISAAQADARLTPRLRRQLEEIFGPQISADERSDIDAFTVRLRPAAKGTSRLRTRFAQPLELLMAAVVLVLLISCAQWDVVGPRYFSTMGIALAAGRDFTDRDDESAPRVIAINEAMAKRFFAATNPIGRRLLWGGDNQIDFEIVAVVRDVRQSGPRDASQVRFYVPYRQLSKTRPSWDLASVQFLVRTADDSDAMRHSLQSSIADEDPRLSIESVRSGPELLERSLVQERMIATLSVAFSLLGVGLACIGLYGLIGYHVAQRTSEIGVRMALGAERSQVLRMTLARALLWTASGIAVGIPIALSVSHLAESLLFGLSPRDTATLAGAAILLLAFGFAAAYIPARRAANIDPLAALRYE